MNIPYLIIDIKFFLLICMYPRFALFTAVMMEMCRVGLEVPFNVFFFNKLNFYSRTLNSKKRVSIILKYFKTYSKN